MPMALNNLGVIYYKGEFVKRDVSKAILYFENAGKKNNTDAQFNLGLLYEKGEYVERDIPRAKHYFELAANQKHSMAQERLNKYRETNENHNEIMDSLAEDLISSSLNPDLLSNSRLIHSHDVKELRPLADKTIGEFYEGLGNNH
ncbi:hypothetical protein TRFO_26815 [Tritrichomonas foetus]|uniref:Sel1 repeat family protein n=1 Tax=Tritrichomonas foetus TaxID=1144522 RepID=A0A1J4K1Z6_9EUKA|nr:hypothetical protein TRFO_26815 [Tritrichomonas foetus]|eukprot:OHT05465.1 hypothetical protein TRFO_26815 [Tritrichomonas foetus]